MGAPNGTPGHSSPMGPIEVILGPDAVAGGPFALLGVSSQSAGRDALIEALEHRLAQVNRHPLAQTPEADEVRLALHAATAHLLSPVVFRHMQDRWGTAAGRAPAARAFVLPASVGTRHELEQDALLTLGLFGGWNDRSLRRLAMLAHARGLPSHAVTTALEQIVLRRAAERASTPPRPLPRAQAPAPAAPLQIPKHQQAAEEYPLDPVPAFLRMAGLLLLVAIVTGVVLVGGLYAILSSANQPPIADDSSPQPVAPFLSEIPTDSDRPTRVFVPSQRLELATAEQMLHELRACLTGLALDPDDARRRYHEAVASLGQAWVLYTPDSLTDINAAAIEFAERSSAKQRSASDVFASLASASAMLTMGPRIVDAASVAPAVWSAGIQCELYARPGISSHMRQLLADELAAIFVGRPAPSSFTAGSVLAARMLSLGRLADDPAAWRAWAKTVGHTPDEPARTSLFIGGLEDLLQRPAAVGPAPAAMDDIVFSLPWQDTAVQRWLLRQFDDRRVLTANLAALTEILASRSAAPGVDLTMALARNAGLQHRRAMRDRYAQQWGINLVTSPDAITADLITHWQQRRDLLAQLSDATQILAEAVTIARLNAAANALWRGRHEIAVADIAAARDPVDQALTTGDNPTINTASLRVEDDGTWTATYIDAGRHIPRRETLLGQLSNRRGKIGPADAHRLIDEALRGSPRRIRNAARDAASILRDTPAVVNAMLELIHDAPQSQRTIELVAMMSASPPASLDDPLWRLAARRSLVVRLLELLSAQQQISPIDRLSELLSDAYAERSGLESTHSSGHTQTLQAEASARQIRQMWLAAVAVSIDDGRISLSRAEIDRQRGARLAIAQGPVQRFAVEQLAAAEAQALATASLSVLAAHEVDAALQRAAQRRRTAQHIFTQIAETELLMAELWQIRLEEESR